MSDEQNERKESLDLLGPPPMLRGEDEALYRALLAEVERMLDPTTILDHIDARDITDKIWEAQRYKRLEPRLIESASISALATFSRLFSGSIMCVGSKQQTCITAETPFNANSPRTYYRTIKSPTRSFCQERWHKAVAPWALLLERTPSH